MILETVLGGLVGTATRSIPAVLEFFDKKNERAHELSMFDKQIEADRVRATQEFEQTKLEGDINFKVEDIKALSAALQGQAEMAASAGGFAAAASALVRPITTYMLVALYMLAKIASFVLMCLTPDTTLDFVLAGAAALYTEDDSALLAGVLAFWYMDRTISKRG